MKEIKFRDIAFKAVMYSRHLNKYYVSEPCRIDGGATSIQYLFGFENDFLDEMWDDLFTSDDYQTKFEGVLDEEQLDDYALLDWVHIGNLQYTGLKDKNGIEIYEGDIVKDITTCKTSEVAYITNTASFEIKQQNGELEQIDIDDIMFYEVIGNIYENPVLLKAD